MNRDERQAAVLRWVKETFGLALLAKEERVARLLEEAIELAQAEGFPAEKVGRIAAHVYSKEPGSPAQEVGGIGVTLLAYCASVGLSADQCEIREFERVQLLGITHFHGRQKVKAEAGIAAFVEIPT